MKYLKISFNLKKIVFIISFLYLMTFISSTITTKPESRNLQYSTGSIYYELQYPINNLTGTGDRLKDVPYMVQCNILRCESGCCVGEIDKMSCGPAADCAIYLSSFETGTTIIIACVIVFFFLILLILAITFNKVFKFSICASVCLSLGCMTIILIPCVIYFTIKEGKNACKNKSKDR